MFFRQIIASKLLSILTIFKIYIRFVWIGLSRSLVLFLPRATYRGSQKGWLVFQTNIKALKGFNYKVMGINFPILMLLLFFFNFLKWCYLRPYNEPQTHHPAFGTSSIYLSKSKTGKCVHSIQLCLIPQTFQWRQGSIQSYSLT